jgi:thermostable 8-oxoguanine DNA glycosylase
MGLISKIKEMRDNAMDKLADVREAARENEELQKKLQKWKERFENARTNYDISVMDERELLYRIQFGAHWG